jgi:NAD(P) transhydrogenase
MITRHYDLVVIGSGPAGEKGAAQAAYFGKKVALVEQGLVLGGAVCNSGTLSSKTLRETALTLVGFRSRALYGVEASLRDDVSVADLLSHERKVTSAERDAIAANLRRHNIELHQGIASFVDPHTIRVDAVDADPVFLTGDVVLIASGSSPRRPETFPFHDPRVWDSDEVANIDFMPRSMAIIGGGVIGCEYACVFAAFGVELYLVDGRDELLDFLDRDVCTVLQKRMAMLGVRFVTGERVHSCDAAGDAVTITLASGRTIEVGAVLVAAGRRSNTERLNLGAAGIAPDERGIIRVNERYQTEVSHIYAAGDVIGFPALASTGMEQARLAMVDAFDLKYKTSAARVLPLGIYTIPEVSVAGETENTLTEKRISYVAGRAYYDDNARGKIIGDSEGMLKLLFAEEDMRLLGVSIVGENATELVHIGLAALMLEANSSLFIEMCFNYPTLGQLYKYATYDAMGLRTGLRRRRERLRVQLQ